MFADLLLALAIATSPAPAQNQTAMTAEQLAASEAPSCMAGPIKVRIRTAKGSVQIAANDIRVDGVDAAAATTAQSNTTGN
jgi:hypothetical protein